MRGLVSRSRIIRAFAWVVPGGALLGVSAVLLVAMAFPAAASPTHKPRAQGRGDVSVSKASYGKLADGTSIDQYTLVNKHGMTVKIITYGGIVTEINTPDRKGKRRERRARLRQPRRLRRARARTSARSPAAMPTASPRQVHARRQGLHARQEQRPEPPARRHQGLRQGGLERRAPTRRRRRRDASATPARTARRAIPARSRST